jgi:hypothetical protein
VDRRVLPIVYLDSAQFCLFLFATMNAVSTERRPALKSQKASISRPRCLAKLRTVGRPTGKHSAPRVNTLRNLSFFQQDANIGGKWVCLTCPNVDPSFDGLYVRQTTGAFFLNLARRQGVIPCQKTLRHGTSIGDADFKTEAFGTRPRRIQTTRYLIRTIVSFTGVN